MELTSPADVDRVDPEVTSVTARVRYLAALARKVAEAGFTSTTSIISTSNPTATKVAPAVAASAP